MTPAVSEDAARFLLDRLQHFSDAPSDGEADARWHFYVLPAIRALQAALSTLAPSAAASDETGWLIELKGQTPHWAVLNPNDYDEHWTPDATKALRFARKQDAEAYIEHVGWTEAFASEHMWCGPALASPSAEAAQPVRKVVYIDILREWFGGDRYARDYEYLDANYREQADRVVAFLAALSQQGEPREGMVLVPRDDAEALLADLNARIDQAPSTAKPVFRGITGLHAALAGRTAG